MSPGPRLCHSSLLATKILAIFNDDVEDQNPIPNGSTLLVGDELPLSLGTNPPAIPTSMVGRRR